MGLSELFGLSAFLALYLIPYWVARSRKHQDRNAILALNLLLAWTLIGWVIALIWSLMGERQRYVQSTQHAVDGRDRNG